MNLRRLTDLALDAVRELGNIGSGHASGALAAMLGRKVDITVPKVTLQRLANLNLYDGPDSEVVAVHLRVVGDVEGLVTLCTPRPTAEGLVHLLTGQAFPVTDPMAVSVMNEVANIIGGAFLSAFYGMTGLNSQLTPPEYFSGQVDGAFAGLLAELSRWGDSAFVVETAFVQEENALPCNLIFIPSAEGLVLTLQRLGLTDIFA
ncbi:MAG: chemotaxis protein CheC [Chitinophagales bacterium]